MLQQRMDIESLASARSMRPRSAPTPMRRRWEIIGVAMAVGTCLLAWSYHQTGMVRRTGLAVANVYYSILDPTENFVVATPGAATIPASVPGPKEVLSALSAAFPRYRIDLACENASFVSQEPLLLQEAWGSPSFHVFHEASSTYRQEAKDIFELAQAWRQAVPSVTPDLAQLEDDPLAHIRRVGSHQPLNARAVCVAYAQLAASMGREARILSLSKTGERIDHTVCEVFLAERSQWVLVDPVYNLGYRRNKEWLNAAQLQSVWRDVKKRLDIRGIVATYDGRLSAAKEMLASSFKLDVVPLGTAASVERQREVLERGTGTHMEALEYVLYASRNDFLSNHYPPGHPRRSERWGLAASSDTPPRPAFCPEMQTPASVEELYPAIGHSRLDIIHVHPGPGSAELDIRLSTVMANFAHFEMKSREGNWQPLAGQQITLDVAPGKHDLEIRSVNAAGIAGEPARLKLAITPLRLARR